MVRQFGQYGGLVSGARSYLKHAIGGLDLRRLKHGGNDVGLRCSLLLGDGNWVIGISFRPVVLAHKLVAWHLVHGRQHPLIMNATTMELLLHHGRTLVKKGLVLFRTHCSSLPLANTNIEPQNPVLVSHSYDGDASAYVVFHLNHLF